MKDIPLGEVIAHRELEFTCEHGEKQTVQVHVGQPVQDGSGPWLCPYRIEGSSFQKQFRMVGEDSMQALSLTMKTIRVELEVLAKDKKGSFTWFGGTDLGFT